MFTNFKVPSLCFSPSMSVHHSYTVPADLSKVNHFCLMISWTKLGRNSNVFLSLGSMSFMPNISQFIYKYRRIFTSIFRIQNVKENLWNSVWVASSYIIMHKIGNFCTISSKNKLEIETSWMTFNANSNLPMTDSFSH